jgi:hypothetical protein
MALIAASKMLLHNSTQLVAQNLVSKQDASMVAKYVKQLAGKHWKKVAFLGLIGGVAVGTYRSLKAYDEFKLQSRTGPKETELKSLYTNAELVEIQRMDNELIESALDDCEYNREPQEDLEDLLMVAAPDQVHFQVEDTELEPQGEDEPEKDFKKREQVSLKKKARFEMKRVQPGKHGAALRALVSKAKLAFPIPKDTEIQAQAINLFLYKECRKLNLRVSDASKLIPKATALAMIPSEEQVNHGQLGGILPMQEKYMRMKWRQNRHSSITERVFSAISSFTSSQ